MKLLLLLPFAAAAALAQNTTQFVVHNNCPTAINLYIKGFLDSKLPQGGNVTRFLEPEAQFFYTDANGGLVNGSLTRAAVRPQDGYYYIVKDPNHFNVGVALTPQGKPQAQGFCETAECDSADCTSAYTTAPTTFTSPGSTAPSPPLYECPGTGIIWDVTFCPTGVFPGQAQQWEIHPGLNDVDKCLDVRADTLANGTPVQVYDCNGTPAQKWVIHRGSTKVQLAGTNFCLDAGSNPASGVGMKIWQCYANLPAQQWYYTDDNRIAVENHGQCLDLTNGILTNGNQVQTWACTTNNGNQVWTLSAPRAPAPPPASRVHPNGNSAKCIDVRAANFANGTPVQIYDCNGTPAQSWVLSRGSTQVRLNGTNFCLDAGSAPGNRVGMKIWQCYDNLPAQTWYYTDDNRIALENQGLCLDLTNGVLTNGNQLQTWQCTNGNTHQIWTL